MSTTEQDRSFALLPDGRRVRPYRDHIFCVAMDLPEGTTILSIPEKYRATFGRHATGVPIAYGKVLACGPKAPSVHPGEFVLIDPLNTNLRIIDKVRYYFPRQAAVKMVVTP